MPPFREHPLHVKVILNNAVVNHNNTPSPVGMGISLRWFAMGCPAGVPYPYLSLQGMLLDDTF